MLLLEYNVKKIKASFGFARRLRGHANLEVPASPTPRLTGILASHGRSKRCRDILLLILHVMLFKTCKLVAVQTTAFHPPENIFDAKYTE